MDTRQDSIKRILAEAVAMDDASERQAYLDRACGGDLELRARVEALLGAYARSGDFLQQPMITPPPEPAAEAPGTIIGRYKLLQEIGEGAFGLVFMAEQTEPVRRRVALKIIKPGMDTREVIARFEAERQALALMDHPNIARVLDGGTTLNGKPYFVMELVNGITITSYCDQHRLSTEQRLKLFIKVCQGVQHAHQKGIIHRDLKPSNILVTIIDGEPVPKIIDFGVAKALGQKLTEHTLFTAFQQMVGTPAYMSPEQAELSGVDVDTRSDIYSLGVLLYELLTGAPPFDTETFAKAGLDEIRRMIRETEPPKPSTRLRSLGDKLTEIAKQRHADPTHLPRLIHGELDWIVMKALEKDRSRRYDTASNLLQDVERHLRQEPVSAGAPGMAYRTGKFVKRHRTGFATALTVIVLLITGAIVSTWLAFRATRAERTQASLRQIADTEAQRSREVAGFLKEMLKGAGPSVAMGRDTTLLREVLEKTARRIDEQLQHSPSVAHEIQLTLGETFLALGDFKRAHEVATAALSLTSRLGTNEQGGKAQALHLLGQCEWFLGDRQKGERMVREALNIAQKSGGTTNALTAEIMATLAEELSIQAAAETRQARLAESREKYTESMNLLTTALDIRRVLFGDQHILCAELLAVLAQNPYLKTDEPEKMLLQALAIQTNVLGADSLESLSTLDSLAAIWVKQGRLQEALETVDRILSGKLRILGENHTAIPTCLRHCGVLRGYLGDQKGAETYLVRGIQLAEKVLGAAHPETMLIRMEGACSILAQGRREEALALVNQPCTPELLASPQGALLLENRADFLGRAGMWKEAAADFERIVQLSPSNHVHYLRLLPLLWLNGDREKYRRACRQALEACGQTSDPFAAGRLARICSLDPSGDYLEDANRLAEFALERMYDSKYIAGRLYVLSTVRYRQKRFDEAIALATKAWETRLKGGSFDLDRGAQLKLFLAMTYWQKGRLAEAAACFSEGRAIMAGLPSRKDNDLGNLWINIALNEIVLREAEQTLGSDRSAE